MLVMSAKNSIGDRFGRLEIIAAASSRGVGKRWTCRCDCGNTKEISQKNLRKGSVKSCGCLVKERMIRFNRECNPVLVTHGQTRAARPTPIYRVWVSMKYRCSNSASTDYELYGARGIKVCERWEKSFENFLTDMGEPEKGMTLDRIDNNGDYCPENCRWATQKQQQQRNRRSNHLLTWRGKTQCLSAWADEVGLTFATVSNRLRRGWTTERTLATPLLRSRLPK